MVQRFEMNLTCNDFLAIHEKYEQEVFELIQENNYYQKSIYNSPLS